MSSLLRELKEQGNAPTSADRFLEAWQSMATTDAFELDSMTAADAVRVCQQILSELTSSPQHDHV